MRTIHTEVDLIGWLSRCCRSGIRVLEGEELFQEIKSVLVHMQAQGEDLCLSTNNERAALTVRYDGLTRSRASWDGWPETGWSMRNSTRTMFESVSRTFPRESARRLVKNFFQVEVLM